MIFITIVFLKIGFLLVPAPGQVVDLELELWEASKHKSISAEYKQGEYLIYDCEGGYFACVDFDSNNNCKNKRSLAWKTKQTRLSCAPLKNFTSIDLCIKEQYRLIFNGTDRSFCSAYRFNSTF
ncbi:MAG: hypothetical protein OXB84_01210 [Halobacteriovoraceae bacterium]|nr:hypothetical protein [Halobacteriovoraceae bacterium]